jgi:phosphoglycerate-specific signal transduction histidine kinase
MEDKHSLLSQGKPLGNHAPGTAPDTSRSPDRPVTAPPDLFARAPDLPITRLPDSQHCRECLAALAHRLAQPMTALRGGMELGLMGKRSMEDYRSLLEQSLQLADSMAQLIVSLRELAESTAPGGPTQSVLLEAAATETLAEMEGLAQSRDLHLQLHTEGEARVWANPERLREALLGLLAWVIQNSAGGGPIAVNISVSDGNARVAVAPPRLDLQYLQIKVLEDITTPGLLFSHAAKNGALGWAIVQRLLDGVGGKLEICAEGPDSGCVRVTFSTPSAS